jgi:hypothetical protein
MVIMEDLDAPRGVFLHWLLYNISPVINELPAGMPRESVVAGLGLQGLNDFGNYGYNGPCPPPGPAHRYVIIVLALNETYSPTGDSRSVINGASGIVGYGYTVGLYGG